MLKGTVLTETAQMTGWLRHDPKTLGSQVAEVLAAVG